MVVITVPVNDELEKQLVRCQEKFNDLKVEASDVRKNGRDTFFFDTKMLDFPSLMKLAYATWDPVDVERVKHLITDLKHELELAKDGEPFEHALHLLSECTLACGRDDLPKARALYTMLSDIYRHLSKEERLLIMDACVALRARL